MHRPVQLSTLRLCLASGPSYWERVGHFFHCEMLVLACHILYIVEGNATAMDRPLIDSQLQRSQKGFTEVTTRSRNGRETKSEHAQKTGCD